MSETPFMHVIRPSVAAPAVASASGPASIKIHTSAVVQILEIVSKQIISSNKRVIGTLLGARSDDGSYFEIRDAFMVPCNETGDSLAIEEHTHKTLFQLYKKAHPKEHVLGWFGSSSQIDSTTGLIHDFYSKGSDRAYPYPAIYLNVEYLSNSNEISLPKLFTYIGAAIGKPNNNLQKIGWKTQNTTNSYIFTPIPNEIISGSISEKLSLNFLSDPNNLRNNNNSISFQNQDEKNTSQLSKEIKSVSNKIEQLLSFINGINTNSISDKDVDLLRHLSNNLLNKPQTLANLDDLRSHFRAHNQDVIMIEYLTKAVKEQIELSARLSGEAEKREIK